MRGDAGRCGEIWGDLGRCGEMWGDVGRSVEICGDLWRCGEIWGDLGRSGEIWGDLERRSPSTALVIERASGAARRNSRGPEVPRGREEQVGRLTTRDTRCHARARGAGGK